MSPVARYVTKVLYEICEVAQEKVALFAHGANAAWLMSMLSANWGTESIWLQERNIGWDTEHISDQAFQFSWSLRDDDGMAASWWWDPLWKR
ncbi:hypothetical protein FQN51_005309 [Onygenales sp. PD_10]|nr:hypothetical protein FQN51_005309 [Onygenales sp. PD_10]